MSKKTLRDMLLEQVEAKGILLEHEKEELEMMEDRKAKAKETCVELQPVEPTQIVPTLAVTLDEARERIKMLQTFVAEMMVEGVDYGKIPGCPKPTLLKPGAEKLCDIMGYSKEVEVVNRLEDWQNGIFHYEVKVRLISKRTGILEAEGIGSCNSREKKYANQDPYTLVNTLMKMADKRGFVSAILCSTRSSNIFTQDIEDMNLPRSSSENIVQEPITKPQMMKIKMLGKELNFSKEDAISLLEKDYGVAATSELTKKQAIQLIKQLMAMQEAS